MAGHAAAGVTPGINSWFVLDNYLVCVYGSPLIDRGLQGSVAISAEVRSERHRVSALEPALAITDNGLVLGGTVLAPMGRSDDGRPKLAIDGAEERTLALLAAVYGRALRPAVLRNIRRASTYWCQGETTLAAIELALAGLPRLADAAAARRRLDLTEKLLAAGVPARGLIKACGLDPGQLDLLKAGYNPAQPRVPAGNPAGGQWNNDRFASGETGYGPPTARPSTATDGGQATSTPPGGEPSAASGIVFADYKIIKDPPRDAKVVIPPNGKPIHGGDPPNLLIAPPHADYRQIYGAGRAIAEFPPWKQYDYVHAAIGQEGTYDFQRDAANRKFYSAYTPAANYAVGVYMAGAGYTLDVTLALAKLYALRNSSNYGTQDQLSWIKQGWRDAKSGRWQ